MGRIVPWSAIAPLLAGAMAGGAATAAAPPADVYATYGVHSDAYAQDCAFPNCVYKRTSGQPTDPAYPPYWTSHWAMYRVFNGYQGHSPPYAGKPPAPLKNGVDYQTSWGATYYDSTWRGPTGQGAMEEHYEHFCLPIFPIANNYSCSFISLGQVAFFVAYADRPKWMPPVCLFSPRNHPPERDFIKHLPYAVGDSVGAKRLGYSFWVTQAGKVAQVGASPDQTAAGDILFGYAFDAKATADRVDKSAKPYRHPQSFYFSGFPVAPANAPIVSQNYTDFAMLRPDPAKTWAQVSRLDPKSLPACQLFNPPERAVPRLAGRARPPTWGDIGRR